MTWINFHPLVLPHDPPFHPLEFGTSFWLVGGKQDRSTNATPCILNKTVFDYAFNVGLRVYVDSWVLFTDKAQIKNISTLSTILLTLQKIKYTSILYGKYITEHKNNLYVYLIDWQRRSSSRLHNWRELIDRIFSNNN